LKDNIIGFFEGCYVVVGQMLITSLGHIPIDTGVVSLHFISFLVF